MLIDACTVIHTLKTMDMCLHIYTHISIRVLLATLVEIIETKQRINVK